MGRRFLFFGCRSARVWSLRRLPWPHEWLCHMCAPWSGSVACGLSVGSLRGSYARFTASPLGVSLPAPTFPTVTTSSFLHSAQILILCLPRRTGELKVFTYHFYVTEKRNWSKSKRESSSSDQIGFQFSLSVSFSMCHPLPALGLHPETGSILDFFQQIIEDKQHSTL